MYEPIEILTPMFLFDLCKSQAYIAMPSLHHFDAMRICYSLQTDRHRDMISAFRQKRMKRTKTFRTTSVKSVALGAKKTE